MEVSRTIEVEVFKFEELSDAAKEKARAWYREGMGPEEFEFVIEDAVRMGELLGIEFDRKPVKLMGGGTRYDPEIYWSLGYSQDDGASFHGTYRYAKGALAKIKENAPKDEDLHGIAEDLQTIQKRHGYKLKASCKSSNRGNQRVEVYHEDYRDLDQTVERGVEQCLQDFAHWIYTQLRTEDEWRNADEQVDESIIANEYEFTADGERA